MNRRRTLALIIAGSGALSLLLTLTPGTASAGVLVSHGRSVLAPPGGGVLSYATNTQIVAGNGTRVSRVACPAGALPVGGGATVGSPQVEQVAQAGFHASPATGKLDGYQAEVQVSGLRRGGKARFAVQVACVLATGIFVVYVVRNQALSADGTTWWAVTCPVGTLPSGGGVTVENQGIEHVAQAGFHASPATGKVDGYEASVRVSGLSRRAKVGFAVQVACIRAVTGFVIYMVHTQSLSADGSSGWGVLCPPGTLPVGGGTAVENPLVEQVAQAGFHAAAAAGKFDGYQATVQVGGLPRGRTILFGVQAACVPAAPPASSPPAIAVSVNSGRWRWPPPPPA